MEFKLFRLIVIACFSAGVISAFAAQQSTPTSQQNFEGSTTYLPGPLDPANMLAPPVANPNLPKSYILAATPATTQWGYFDSSVAPVLNINSGDSVIIETAVADNNQLVPGVTVNQLLELTNAVPSRGPHTLTGPIYINDAMPGDVLQIHFNKIVPRAYASNDDLPKIDNKGLFPDQFPNGHIKYFYLDVENKKAAFAPNIILPLAPFPGIVAVARQTPGKFNSSPPGPFGGNLDLREMTEGTTLYLPVFVKGALLWTGDSHAGQGNGEINLTAIETAFKEFNITVNVIKQKPLAWPRVETPTAWIAIGYDRDLNKALDLLKSETIKLIMEQRKVSSQEAEKIMYETWNCPIAEVVNGVKGTYCMIPKAMNAPKPIALPNEDSNTQFVTYAKDKDIEKAMQLASMAMINKIVAEKQLSRIDAYTLLSLTMDCRIAPYKGGDKEVHCMVAKNLWTV